MGCLLGVATIVALASFSCRADSRGSFLVSVTDHRNGRGQGETICFVHMVPRFMNTLKERALDWTLELIWVQTATEAFDSPL